MAESSNLRMIYPVGLALHDMSNTGSKPRQKPEPSTRATWIVIAVYSSVALYLYNLTGFAIPYANGPYISSAVISAACSFGLLFLLKPSPLTTFMNAISQYTLFSLSSVMLCFAAATSGSPLADETMIWFDEALGFHWNDWFELLRHSYRIHTVLGFSYNSFFVQPVLGFLIVAIAKRKHLADEYIICSVVAMIITAAIFTILPVTTAWFHVGVSMSDIQRLHLPTSPNDWIHQLLAVRSGERSLPELPTSAGLIGFPSFHVIGGLLNIRLFWHFRPVRYPMTALNVILILATPIDGGHYVADIIGGAAVLIISLPLARWLLDRLSKVDFPTRQSLVGQQVFYKNEVRSHDEVLG